MTLQTINFTYFPDDNCNSDGAAKCRESLNLLNQFRPGKVLAVFSGVRLIHAPFGIHSAKLTIE